MTPSERVKNLSPELRDAALLRWFAWFELYKTDREHVIEELEVMIKRGISPGDEVIPFGRLA